MSAAGRSAQGRSLSGPPGFARWLGAAAMALAMSGAGAQDRPPAAPAPVAAACPPVARAPTPQQVQDGMRDARDRGFLWRISKGGRTSYLYGTIHVGRLAWIFPGRTVAAALRETDTLALELDVLDPTTSSGVAAASAGAANAPLPAPLAQRLQRQLAAACVPPAAVRDMPPVMQAVMLSLLAGRWDGLDAAYGQELALAGAARALQRPVAALETVQAQLRVIAPDDPAQTARLVEDTLDLLERDRVRPVLARLGTAWESGNLDELERYEQWCECADSAEERAFLHRLNDDRNPSMAERLHALHDQGKRVFAAVGALHMTGANALPKLMAERGFTVERIVFDR